MGNFEIVRDFLEKWENSILGALEIIGQAVDRAGYSAGPPESDVDYDGAYTQLRYLMRVVSPGRPLYLEGMDALVCFTLLESNEGTMEFVPFIEIFNNEGSFYDEIDLSRPMSLQDPSWGEVITSAKEQASDIILILDSYFPKPAKRRWKILVTTPENVQLHPSTHTNEDIAKEDVSFRLTAMVEKMEELFWELEVLKMYSGWNSRSTYAISEIRYHLEEQETWVALRKYHRFLDTMEPSLRKRVIKKVGSLNVERLGGFEDEY